MIFIIFSAGAFRESKENAFVNGNNQLCYLQSLPLILAKY